jgi:hypothetical protein
LALALKIIDTRFTTLIGATIPSSCNACASHLRRAATVLVLRQRRLAGWWTQPTR